MTERDKKMIKLLCVLGPVLLLTIGYGYNQLQETKARKAALALKARQQQEAAKSGSAAEAKPAVPATARTTSTHTSSLPAGGGSGKPGNAPAAVFGGVRVRISTPEQDARARLPWGRDPFTPPDIEGPVIEHLSDIESPRGKKSITLSVRISDIATGNHGILSAVIRYGYDEPFDQHTAKGTRPQSDNGDGTWTFEVPAPEDHRPLGCSIVATDAGQLRSRTRSAAFKIIPPSKETVQAQIDGTNIRLTLRGISWSGTKGVALINSDVLAEGEQVHGYTVEKILKNGVTLKRNGQEIFLQLKE